MDKPTAALNDKDIERFLSGQFHNMLDFTVDLDIIAAGDLDSIMGPDRHSRIIFIENPGSRIGHFTLLSHLGDHLEWFDPRGGPPPEEIIDFSRRAGLKLRGLQPHAKLQGPTTYVCGKWCILRYLSLPTSMEDFVNIFRKLKDSPDSVVDKLIRLKTRDE